MNERAFSLGIELGSTRIKAVLLDRDLKVSAQGSYDWSDHLEQGYWSYGLDEVKKGLQSAYRDLASNYEAKYGEVLTEVSYLAVSAMMHGFLVFDEAGKQLTPFRTWRNVNTDEASRILSEKLAFNIPHRWSVAHLYQAILDDEPYVDEIHLMTTLSGYVHEKLSGERALGIGDAAGMFPIAQATKDFDQDRIKTFNALEKVQAHGIDLRQILPEVKVAGEKAGVLTEAGARFLDPTGQLRPGAVMSPPEGDAGTGMTATCAIRPHGGNVSTGTSIFAMLVLDEELSDYYPEIDMVTTPDGLPVAMVHCNNGSPEMDAWVELLGEVLSLFNVDYKRGELYDQLFYRAMEGAPDAGGLLSYNFLAGEPIAGVHDGRPMYLRTPDSTLNLANFMLSQLYAILTTLRRGMDILVKEEEVAIDDLVAHGGVFKTPGVVQKLMASALKVPVTVYEQAGEGGAWGSALLAAFVNHAGEMTLADYLDERIFKDTAGRREEPEDTWVQGFDRYYERYLASLKLAAEAAEYLN